jgi:7,8-dihydropterin-6-yl-methyl-4-(beta-D-ribofuranosyl)aminobenzene 5'-phosphate synthase
VGGLHLFAADEATLDSTDGRLKAMVVGNLLGAHCTGVEATYALRPKLGLDRRTCVVGAVGSGFDLEAGIRPGTIAR